MSFWRTKSTALRPRRSRRLLEAMQERQVSVGGQARPLADPFFVLATQNPIEQEGTYPLPEAQQDRFMMKVFVRYPSFEEEFEIARRTTVPQEQTIDKVLTAHEIIELQQLVREVPVSSHVIRFAPGLGTADARGRRGSSAATGEFIILGGGSPCGAIPGGGRQGPSIADGAAACHDGRHRGVGAPHFAPPPRGELCRRK